MSAGIKYLKHKRSNLGVDISNLEHNIYELKEVSHVDDTNIYIKYASISELNDEIRRKEKIVSKKEEEVQDIKKDVEEIDKSIKILEGGQNEDNTR